MAESFGFNNQLGVHL